MKFVKVLKAFDTLSEQPGIESFDLRRIQLRGDVSAISDNVMGLKVTLTCTFFALLSRASHMFWHLVRNSFTSS